MKTELQTAACEKMTNHKFLFWKWQSIQTVHNWVYSDAKNRQCRKCNIRELYFGIKQLDTTSYGEDWRPRG